MKVFLLGLDGLTLRIVEPYVQAGLLPNFKKVMEKGAHGILRSTTPAVTGPGWTSMATGKNPGKHGIYEFRRRKGYKTEIITRNTSVHAEPIWKILSREGKRVVVANVPMTYPPDAVNGIMVSGLMTPGLDTNFVYPAEFKKELLAQIPGYQLDIDSTTLFSNIGRKKLMKEIFKVTEDGRYLMHYLLEKEPWDFFFYVFVGSDRIQHFMWDKILSQDPECVHYYQLLDAIVGDLLKRLDDDTVLWIASDHGFCKVDKFFAINSFFHEAGFLDVHEKHKSKIDKPGATSQKILSAVADVVKSFHVAKILPDFLVDRLKKLLPNPEFTVDLIDWEKTRAFSLLEYGLVSLNLRGREPNGIVEEHEYDRLCTQIKDALLAVTDPETGKTIVKDVLRGHHIYSLEHGDHRPDLIVVMHEGYRIYVGLGRSILSENRLRRVRVTADHEREGLFAVYGKPINNEKIEAEIYDLVPTLLYLMGMAIPEDVDGRVLKEIICEEFVEKNEVKFEKAGKLTASEANTVPEEDEEAITRQLKKLGYLN